MSFLGQKGFGVLSNFSPDWGQVVYSPPIWDELVG